VKQFADVVVLAITLLVCGVLLDRGPSLDQALLFGSVQVASLGGVAIATRRFLEERPRAVQARLIFGALLAWRLAYFPIMVFSGHVASIGEWIQIGIGLPPLVYPVFLVSAAVLHGLVITAAAAAVLQPRILPKAVIVGGFVFASLISFSGLADLTLLPDSTVTISEEIPPLVEGRENPYLPALSAPGYAPNQRLMLVAAGLTYETIPDAPWARAVRSALEESFRANPIATTRDRVLEHYLAYHTAQPRLSGAPPSDP